MDKELTKLTEAFASIQTKYQEKVKLAKADVSCNETSNDDIVMELLANLSSRISYLSDRVWQHQSDLYSTMASHNDGHLPKIKSVQQMKKALKTLGLEDEVEVRPSQVIYASRNSLVVDIDYQKPK